MTKAQLSETIKASVEELGTTTEPMKYYSITEDIFGQLYMLPFPANSIERQLNKIGFWKEHVYKMGTHLEYQLRQKERYKANGKKMPGLLNPLDKQLLSSVMSSLILHSLLPGSE